METIWFANGYVEITKDGCIFTEAVPPKDQITCECSYEPLTDEESIKAMRKRVDACLKFLQDCDTSEMIEWMKQQHPDYFPSE